MNFATTISLFRRAGGAALIWAAVGLCLATTASADDRPLAFGVIAQRSPVLTAAYWNPILDYVSRRTGIGIELRISRSGPETVAMVVHGDLDLVYTNNLFSPDKLPLDFHVIARPDSQGIRGEIVVLSNSSIKNATDLVGKRVAFPSPVAFIAYQVTGDALVKAGISVSAQFAGNQEGAMGQLRAGVVDAASVNSAIMADYAAREHMEYRVILASSDYLDIPIMVGPSVKPEAAAAIQEAFVGMLKTEEGATILLASAKIVGGKPVGFVAASDQNYDHYRQFFKLLEADKLPK